MKTKEELQTELTEAGLRAGLRFALWLLGLSAWTAAAAVRYVNVANQTPGAPYLDWASAATTIQEAVDTAADGDTVLVTNGVYSAGGRTVGSSALLNRVVIDKAIRLESVNGPGVTVIEGAPAPMGDPLGNGEGAVRCLYLGTSNTVVSGFTVTKGHTRAAGDFEMEQTGGGIWCASGSAVIANCIVKGNCAGSGGGVFGGFLQSCALFDNRAHSNGGGAYGAGWGRCTLDHCTLTGNSADFGGGAYWCVLIQCIVYYNTAQNSPNYFYGSLNYCCTTPLPPDGTGNLSLEPELASTTHVSAVSPCRAAGLTNEISGGDTTNYFSGADLDGETWASPPSIGCDEYYDGAVNGPLEVRILSVFTNVASGYPLDFTATVDGRTTASVWDFGDGVMISNRPYASHVWNAPGDFTVKLVAYNESLPGGQSASVTVHVTSVPTHYVAAESVHPASPYSSWATAARNIQDAVDAASPGAVVMVTNGVYSGGGRAMAGRMTNRVAVDKKLTLQSVNGPGFTVIQGNQVTGSTNGVGAIRCVYLTSGAILSGFTLTNGATSKSASDWYGEESGGGVWCQSIEAVVTNCIITGNSASYAGGGAYGGTLYDCVLNRNTAQGDNASKNSAGGGAYTSTLVNCTVSGNQAGGEHGCGGGASGSKLDRCIISNNSAIDSGGGVQWQCTLVNCTVTGNSSGGYGGGAQGSTLYNCVLSRNSAGSGGGASGSQLVNCTLTGNSVDRRTAVSAYSGGGVSFCSLLNCIVYYNTAVWGSQNYDPGSTLKYCCTTPALPSGFGNISLEPQLASASHLSANSPCRGAGAKGSSTGSDFDGDPWCDPPSIGCDEYYAGAVTGPLQVAMVATTTNIAAGSEVTVSSVIEGRATGSVWDFGDGVIVSNRPYASHTWAVPGDYTVGLRVYNESYPDGVTAAVTVHITGQLTHYVALESTNPVPPFTSWTTAATNIQDAVDAAMAGDEVIVADGVYTGGGRAVGTNALSNRVAVTKPLALRSANGPEFTQIQGAKGPDGSTGEGAVRCVYLANGASLLGFTLTNGATRNGGGGTVDAGEQAGGGAWCESGSATLSNCVVVGNSAAFGGGAYGGTLYNCLLTANAATGDLPGGGGAYLSTLYNCTLTDNSAVQAGGGVSWGTLYNCIVYYNTAPLGSNYVTSSLNYCCTTPTPTNGIGNAPLFVNNAKRDLHLKSNSPCINAGNNAYVAAGKDYDGNPRVVSGTVDIGAYEYQGTGSVLSYLASAIRPGHRWLRGFSGPRCRRPEQLAGMARRDRPHRPALRAANAHPLRERSGGACLLAKRQRPNLFPGAEHQSGPSRLCKARGQHGRQNQPDILLRHQRANPRPALLPGRGAVKDAARGQCRTSQIEIRKSH